MALFVSYSQVLTNLVASLLIIGFGILVGNILFVLARKIFQSFEVERILHDQGYQFPVEQFVSSLIRYVTYIAGLIWGLTFLGLETTVLYIVLFVILGLLTGFILLAFKDFIPNFVAGFFLHMTQKVRKGDEIKMDVVEGKVVSVDMLETKIRTADGDVVVIPNVLLSRSAITKKKS